MTEVSKNVQKITAKHGGKNLEFSKTDEEAQALWQGRKAALWSVMALKEGSRVWTTDVWYVPRAAEVSRADGLQCAYLEAAPTGPRDDRRL